LKDNVLINKKKFSTLYEDPSNEYREIVGNSFIEESGMNNVSKIQSETGKIILVIVLNLQRVKLTKLFKKIISVLFTL